MYFTTIFKNKQQKFLKLIIAKNFEWFLSKAIHLKQGLPALAGQMPVHCLQAKNGLHFLSYILNGYISTSIIGFGPSKPEILIFLAILRKIC